jgi:hypothetical protein
MYSILDHGIPGHFDIRFWVDLEMAHAFESIDHGEGVCILHLPAHLPTNPGVL